MIKDSIALMTLWLISEMFSTVYANDLSLNSKVAMSLKPKECVVLKEGDSCTVTVLVSWLSSEPDSVCLYRSNSQVQLKCWDGKTQGQFQEKLKLKTPVDYSLVRLVGSDVLAVNRLELSWVYNKKSRPANSWRLF